MMRERLIVFVLFWMVSLHIVNMFLVRGTRLIGQVSQEILVKLIGLPISVVIVGMIKKKFFDICKPRCFQTINGRTAGTVRDS